MLLKRLKYFSEDEVYSTLSGAAGAAALAGGAYAIPRITEKKVVNSVYEASDKLDRYLKLKKKGNNLTEKDKRELEKLEEYRDKTKDRIETWTDEDRKRVKALNKLKDARHWVRENWSGVNGLSGELKDAYRDLRTFKDFAKHIKGGKDIPFANASKSELKSAIGADVDIRSVINDALNDLEKKDSELAKKLRKEISNKNNRFSLTKRGAKDINKGVDKVINEFLKEHKEGLSKGSGRAKVLGAAAGVLGAGAAAGYGIDKLRD